MDKESLSLNSRITILVVAFLGWFFGGMQIGMTNLINDATKYLIIESGWSDKLTPEQLKNLISDWWAYQQCAFLFGAAAGGYIFGKLGDRIGRTRTLGISILWFSALTGIAYFVKILFNYFAFVFLPVWVLGVVGRTVLLWYPKLGLKLHGQSWPV